MWPRLSPNTTCAARCVTRRPGANRERLQRESDNREDMVAFLVAEQKVGAVGEWEAERHKLVRLEAEQRRAEQRLDGARALARMRDRGETVAGIAQLGGCSVKFVPPISKNCRPRHRLRAAMPTTTDAALDLGVAVGQVGVEAR